MFRSKKIIWKGSDAAPVEAEDCKWINLFCMLIIFIYGLCIYKTFILFILWMNLK